ncbi:MAG: hypothetical protein ABI969_18915, partial [bacterium]
MSRIVFLVRRVLAVAFFAVAVTSPCLAQSRVGADSAARLTRYGRDLLFGTALGFAYAGVDQIRNDPAEWGKGWPGYEKRLASNVGEFLVQETTTHILASALNRPLDYQRCHCHGASDRVEWALLASVTDPTASRGHV